MRVLIVSLAPPGDVVQALPIVHDLRRAQPDALITWVADPAVGRLLRRADGVQEVIECALPQWRRAWWSGASRAAWSAFRERLQRDEYDLAIELDGSSDAARVLREARVAKGRRFGADDPLDTEAVRGLWERRGIDRVLRSEPTLHLTDRARAIVAQASGHAPEGPPSYGLRATVTPPKDGPATVAFVHGSAHDARLWPIEQWVALGKRVIGAGWRIGLPQVNEAELTRAELIAAGLQYERAFHVEIWPASAIDAVLDRLATVQAVVGIDSALSRIAVALDLPHVQIHNLPTAARRGPRPGHGQRHQVAVEGPPTPTMDAVWLALKAVLKARVA